MTQGTVLLVDDEELLRRLLSRMLAEAGWEVIQAENGARALEVARVINGGLGLVVTDVHMPVMDGVELGRKLRLLNPALPILYITGRDLPPDLADGIPDGSLLRKPFRTEIFIEMVRRLIVHSAESSRIFQEQAGSSVEPVRTSP